MEDYKAEFIGSDSIVHMGVKYTGIDALGKLCRKLERGTLHVYRCNKKSMTVDVEKRAQLSLRENDKRGLYYGKYVPFDKGIFE